MKKIIGIILIVLGIITTSIGAITFFDVKSDMPSSIAIIGGVDGPTSVFIAGKIGAPMYGANPVMVEALYREMISHFVNLEMKEFNERNNQ